MMAVRQRAAASLLRRMGEPATLNGVDCGHVHLAHGVDVAIEDTVARRTVATISRVASPRVGQTLVHPEGTFKLDALLRDNGSNPRFVVRPV